MNNETPNILDLVYAPDYRLKIKSEPVAAVDDNLRKFMDDMLGTMLHADGAGLSAVQVGVHKRIMIVDLPNEETRDGTHVSQPIFMVNPVITGFSEDIAEHTEGCLSFPGIYVPVDRKMGLDVTYLDYHGIEQTITATGWRAICVQHEMDHLDGITFADRVSSLRRALVMKKAEQVKKKLLRNQ